MLPIERKFATVSENCLRFSWISATFRGRHILESFDAKLELENWTEGIYFLYLSHRTAIIAINQLPITPETLLLRLLGRGKPKAKR
ncbi:MAG: hypothetical protein EWV75_22020 [Microcystis wesenbergii Mw_QC_S_20081001_S30D]|jgi:hypothetical protein|uniref:Uncharacterized protein n=1 Tax=Microcystis wesenbergii Mw_QC_S_20081001_S30D TaxID=2486245 RepID=A0A552J7R6_9CHRO|nr:MAG: hypothetical protein EWV75_22020 [Microcystis wesenbergii Mw_QC_S_20081001_S30D]TRV03513.1 MAG: hypothetical protein EWV74_06630 [Microcystis wesenbergii Mw_QC_S_20081001_S30]TRV04355.1 MAG: hypothetical protein EWV73_03095 [Microcystis wesenbergii Mw_QC_B_20070930_S4D]TRV13922.1 MAG: hypothetical protein EWV89_10320 [Microcystis wesenbergii Mw_QC_B_20070930_S4]